MINMFEVNETNKMIEQENLDVRTITLGISLLDCIDSDLDKVNQNIYNKITTLAKDLVKTGKTIENRYSIPIVNKRISITPIALIGGAACKCPEDFVTIAKTLNRAAKTVGVNFIGGYSALNYLIKVKEMPFTQAVETIMGNLSAAPPAFAPAPKVSKEKVLLLPQTNHSATHAVEYLHRRGIDDELDRFLHPDQPPL